MICKSSVVEKVGSIFFFNSTLNRREVENIFCHTTVFDPHLTTDDPTLVDTSESIQKL